MDPLDFLFSLERLGMKFGLENMRALVRALGHPERAFQSVIVARHQRQGLGHGDGRRRRSMPPAIAAARYTSPHLERLEERFVIDGREVETGELRVAAGAVQTAVERLRRDGMLRPADVLRVRDRDRLRAVPPTRA